MKGLWDWLVTTKFRIFSLVLLFAAAGVVTVAAMTPEKWLWGLGLGMFFVSLFWLMAGTQSTKTGNWHPTTEAAQVEDALLGQENPESKPSEEGLR